MQLSGFGEIDYLVITQERADVKIYTQNNNQGGKMTRKTQSRDNAEDINRLEWLGRDRQNATMITVALVGDDKMNNGKKNKDRNTTRWGVKVSNIHHYGVQ